MEEKELNKKSPVSGLEYPEFAAHYAEEQMAKAQHTFACINEFFRKLGHALKAVEQIRNGHKLFGNSSDNTLMYEDISEVLSTINAAAMLTCCSIYYQYSQPIYVSPFRGLRVAEEEDLKRFGQEILVSSVHCMTRKFCSLCPCLAVEFLVSRTRKAVHV